MGDDVGRSRTSTGFEEVASRQRATQNKTEIAVARRCVKSRADRNYGRGDALATGACGTNYATVDALQGHSHRGNSTESQIESRLRFPLKVGAEDRRQ